MRSILSFFFGFTCLCFVVDLHAISIPDLGGTHHMDPPNPLDLKVSWWEYYDADSKTLAERKESTEELFSKILGGLDEIERERAKPFFDRILIGLQTLIDFKSVQTPILVPNFPEDQSYSYQEWILLSQKLLESEKEIQHLKIKYDLALASYKSGSTHLDSLFASYTKRAEGNLSKLIDGLTIMQSKISLAVEKVQMVNLHTFVGEKQKYYGRLKNHAEGSYKQVDFHTIETSYVERELQEAQVEENKAYNDFLLSYELTPMAFADLAHLSSLDREIAAQKLINSKVEYEIRRMQVMNLEVQKLIIGWMKKEIKISRKALLRKIEGWNRTILEIQRDIAGSENRSELILQQSLKSIALQKEHSYQDLFPVHSLKMSEVAILKIQTLKNSLFLSRFLIHQLVQMKHELIFSFVDQFAIWWDALGEFFKRNGQWFNQSLFKIGEFPITLFGLVKLTIILIIATLLAKVVRRYVYNLGLKQSRIDITSVYIFSRLTYYFILMLGILIAGTAIGFDLTVFAYIAGAVAIWVGFSLQSIFHNLISGTIVLLTKALRINDIIELDTGELGKVIEISLRTTIIQTFDGKDLVLPNSELVNKKFKNWNLSTYVKRLEIPFRISLQEDKRKVADIVKDAAKQVSITSESREPELWVVGYGENYLNVQLVVWINSYLLGKTFCRQSLYYWAIDDALKAHNIEIPIPVREVQMSHPQILKEDL